MPFGRANEAQRGVYDFEVIQRQPEVNERTKRLHKKKKHRTEKLGAELNIKFGYEAKAMFSGAVYFRDALCNDTPRRKEKIGGYEKSPVTVRYHTYCHRAIDYKERSD